VRLLDVSLLVPLLWPAHVHYERAQDWFTSARPEGFATCSITQLGCVRVLSLPALSQGALSPELAARLLVDVLDDPYHRYWPTDLPVTDQAFRRLLPYTPGHKQLTDRYLLALAAAHDGTFATLDQSADTGLPRDSSLLEHLEIVPI
jgi:hypothetical protein